MTKKPRKKPGPKKPKAPKPTPAGPQQHFIPDWLVHRNRIAAELAKETGADKGTVSRWVNGEIPSKRYIKKVAGFLECNVNDLFHHPKELPLINKFRAQDDDGQERFANVVNNAFPT
jgi:transcriptional regulator with XRE-family HTH domain